LFPFLLITAQLGFEPVKPGTFFEARQDPPEITAQTQMQLLMNGMMIMLEEVNSMSNEEIQSISEDPMEMAMKMMTSEKVLERVVDKNHATLVEAGVCSKEEIAILSDTGIVEKIKQNVQDQMKALTKELDKIKPPVEAMMTSSQKQAINSLSATLSVDLKELFTQKTTPSDLEIEEMRLKMIQKPNDSLMASIFGGEIHSSKGWKQTVMDGRGVIGSVMALGDHELPVGGMAGMAGIGVGAGVGEL
jgi:hypothetical protein